MKAFAEAGADLVFPTGMTPPQVGAIRAEVGKPIVMVDTPGFGFDDEEIAGISIVLYYGLSLCAQYAAVKQALEALRRERHGDRVPGWRETVTELEWFLGYPEFAARVMKYGGG
jgi:2-methylisocitrate lyase-like PEP mutase family enzyme